MGVARTNLTVQLDDEVIRKARVVAAKRGTSVSALVAQELGAIVARDERYDAARDRALELLNAAIARGGRTWTRDALYEDRLDRHGH